ncbi:hypothetical protein AAHB56_09015, partial [Bacillus thuringiensis]
TGTSFAFYQIWCLTFREQTKLRVFRIYRETLSRFRAPLQCCISFSEDCINASYFILFPPYYALTTTF